MPILDREQPSLTWEGKKRPLFSSIRLLINTPTPERPKQLSKN
jgi:hypothetical protein